MFRDRFWLSLALSVPVLLFSEMIQGWLGFSLPAFPGDDLVAPILGSAVFLYGGQPFLTGGLEEARARRPGMMLLIALALIVAFGASVASAVGWLDLEFWWELALLVDVMLLGHWLEMRALGQATSALDALAALLPDTAERVTESGTEEVTLDALRPGDVLLVRSGARVPTDGTIVEGEAAFDESMITGESRPVTRRPGDRIVGGTIATDSSVRATVTAVGEETTLAGIRRLVAEAQASRSRAQALADRAAALLFYVALASGTITLIAWLAAGEPDQAMERTVTVLVIACPHALGLAIPLVIAISTAMSARDGILVKDRLALERMRTVDTVLFDKTGTLTTGTPAVREVVTYDGDEDTALSLAAAAEADSEHPLARAIVEEARRRGLDAPAASGFRSISGRGVRADVQGSEIAVGGPALLRELGVEMAEWSSEAVGGWRRRGSSILTVVRDGKPVAMIALEDTVRPESRQAVADLKNAGLQVLMITGDAREVAEAVGRDLGIDDVRAEVVPERKEAVVVELQREGRRVAMVGDGVNDAPALARADVGIAIGAGTDVAIGSAGVILASDDPRGVSSVLRLSRASYAKMVQNLVWATGYNALALPLAAGVLAPWGVVLAPAVGAVAMSLSTIVVASNALLLRRLDLRPGEAWGHLETAPAGTR
ncbi:MAG TPA: heavy metal translocating P-type ATPase [Actinomycetota bacterium]|nr:heavy metal translocating P-type ATPase [Actinomycetota bacterium]